MPEIVIALPTALIIVLTYLYLKERQLNNKILQEQPKKGGEALALDQKGVDLLHDAIKKSQDILNQAQLDSLKIISDTKVISGKIDKEYEEKLTATLESIEKNLSSDFSKSQQAISNTQTQFTQFLQDLRQKSEKSQFENQEVIKQQINKVFETFEQDLADFLTQTEQRSVQSIDLELRAARQLIETYKSEQLKLIDENIIAILEKTLSLVLVKKFTLKDHIDLVYEALEKAKVEKFII